MGSKQQNMSNQMNPPKGTSQNPQPTTLPQYPTIGSNPSSTPATNSNSIPDMPLGKGNSTNSATSGQAKMGQPNNNMRP